jgi:hypothetical protein
MPVLLAPLVFAAMVSVGPQAASGAECGTWRECRQQALQAAEQRDYERFHDLAWRAVQKGPRNDADLMLLLARAQSLSGRPGDALVMLERLAALGVATDAATSPDFARVRELPGWAALDPQRSGVSATPAPSAAPAPPAAVPVPSTPAPPAPAAPAPDVPPPAAATPAGTSPAAPPPAALPHAVATSAAGAAEALRFSTLAFTPAGLAYDRVSSRFIVGDHDASKLTVVDEASQRVANLVGAQSAGFGTIGALEIDVHEGDLWVVSSPADSPGAVSAPRDEPRSVPTLHKLQLISGRTLYMIPLEASLRPARFADVAVTPHSSILVLDSQRRRVFVVQPRARRLELAMPVDAQVPTSVAPLSDDVAYVAHEGGLIRLDLTGHLARDISAPAGVSLSGLMRIRFHHGALVAVQRTETGSYRIVRFGLDAAERKVTSVDVLDDDVHMKDPTAAALVGDVFYYLAAPPAPADAMRLDTIVRRVTVR